ncbi:hydroxymethylglutaryl-CoA reductase [Lactobacillus porci]|uniref:Hydroxymethylglutaryl-CoA reductase n=1 Tax=Lactobacillus porci TaxID=2012477 RepID=A0A6A8MEL0_9LACO|nr:hydroxymethylglutaryl-CoA reductase [Lactobacillus porci]MST87219.1 hydroxymethylglutaryl-CoA reductase [Lactobacillus porci]
MKFYQMSPQERREELDKQGASLEPVAADKLDRLNDLSENVIGELELPLSCLTGVLVNNQEWRIPMSTEEASVVAAANHGFSVFAKNGGVIAQSRRDGIYGQIVLQVGSDFDLPSFTEQMPAYIDLANEEFSSLVRHGGGVRQIAARQEDDLVYLLALIDPAEAMGANKANAILEFLAGKMQNEPGVKDQLFAILSNYPSQLTRAEVTIDFATLTKDHDSVKGEAIAKKMALLSRIGQKDVYRAVTNNKGIMNGVDAVLAATGNDTRAVEAASHAYAVRDGRYQSLSSWEIKDGALKGKVVLPLALGVVGGSISSRPDIRQSYSILGKIKARDLANLVASVALANNFAAINAISTKGIQEGHMRLQTRNVVDLLEATPAEKKAVFEMMTSQHQYGETAAKVFLKELRGR